jgi:radical SAM superfamily enzyme YgiQ (UPF0313 family)
MNKTIDLKIYLADLTYTQQTIAADVIPQAIGGIASYAEKHLKLKHKIKLFKYPEKLISFLEKEKPDIIGFSNYIWNFELSKKFCKVIKKIYPDTITVIGGPNFPIDEKQLKEFAEKNNMFDFIILKEGELAFKNLIEKIHHKTNTKKKNINNYCIEQKIITENERIKNLSDIPSPYFNKYLDEFFDGKLMPIIQTNRGCPFSCTFCVEGVKYYNKINLNDQKKVNKELNFIGKKMYELSKNGNRNDLFIADSNFGMYKDDINTCEEIRLVKQKYKWPDYINVATGKNQKERVLNAAKLLDGAMRLSGSVQSLDNEVLKNIKRSNISSNGLIELALEGNKSGANTYSEVILGLPGDSLHKHFNTVKLIVNAGFVNVYLFQLMILPGTELDTPETKDKFNMDIKYRILPRCYGHYKLKGHDILSAEVERVCIGNNTLPFKDYLEARKMHLAVTIFYNDSIFSSVKKFLQINQIELWDWIMEILHLMKSSSLKTIMNDFEKDTKKELWDSESELKEFSENEEIIEKFISGEIGNNLLFTYKTRAITEHCTSLCEIVLESTTNLLKKHKLYNQTNKKFIEECVNFHKFSMMNIFKGREKTPNGYFTFNIKKFINHNFNNFKINDIEFKKTRAISFVHNEDQKSILNNFEKIYGKSELGIARILSKIHTKKFYRVPSISKKNTFAKNKSSYILSGLQN